LWAYLTIKRYLDAKDVAAGNTTEYESKALELSKKYSFVTPLTSLVVVKPDQKTPERPVDIESADQSGNRFNHYAASSSYPALGYRQSLARPLSVSASGFGGGIRFLPGAPVFNSVQFAAPIPPGTHSFAKIGGGGAGYSGFGGGGAQFGPPAPPPASFAPSFHAAVVEDSELDSDIQPLIVGHSTTMFTTKAEMSTTIPTTTSTAEPVTLPPAFSAKLPWLEEQMRPDGTLKFLKGTYQLGFNATSPADEDCTDPKSEEGLCVLLKDCEDIYAELTSPKTFKDYFCAIDDKFVGVCCSKKSKVAEP